MSTNKRFNSFEEFWPFYLGEHSNPINRALHYIGTSLCCILLAFALMTLNYWVLFFVLVPGYFWAWIGHFFIQKNKPATFQHPIWSFRGDLKMYFYFLTGRISSELKKHRIE